MHSAQDETSRNVILEKRSDQRKAGLMPYTTSAVPFAMDSIPEPKPSGSECKQIRSIQKCKPNPE